MHRDDRVADDREQRHPAHQRVRALCGRRSGAGTMPDAQHVQRHDVERRDRHDPRHHAPRAERAEHEDALADEPDDEDERERHPELEQPPEPAGEPGAGEDREADDDRARPSRRGRGSGSGSRTRCPARTRDSRVHCTSGLKSHDAMASGSASRCSRSIVSENAAHQPITPAMMSQTAMTVGRVCVCGVGMPRIMASRTDRMPRPGRAARVAARRARAIGGGKCDNGRRCVAAAPPDASPEDFRATNALGSDESRRHEPGSSCRPSEFAAPQVRRRTRFRRATRGVAPQGVRQ